MAEQEHLGSAVRGAASGQPCAVWVHGEAGVGKTRLVTAAAEHARELGHHVLWGRCLRFGATSSPYLPLIAALEGWLATADEHSRSSLLTDVPAVADLVPSLGGGVADGPPTRLLPVLDAALTMLSAQRPVVLVVDDLQWADVSSRDALAYLVAGLQGRRLAVLGTYRDDQLGVGDALHGWLADLRRLPSVEELPLQRLDALETREQVTMLLGREPDDGLVEEIALRSSGNPYLTELLVLGLDEGADRLSETVPQALRTELLARWHRLSGPARELMLLLAVSGRPTASPVLAQAAGPTGYDAPSVEAAVHETEEAGVAQVARDGVWFRHPLLAEVLSETLLPGEAARYHRAFADVLRSTTVSSVHGLAELAEHCAGAGLTDEAFEHFMLAAEAAERVRAFPEESVLRARAIELWPAVSAEVRSQHPGEVAQLARAARSSRVAGDVEQAYRLIDRAREASDPERDPLGTADVLVLWSQMAFLAGVTPVQSLDELTEALRLTEHAPDSAVHAEVLAELGDVAFWRGDRAAAREYADRAVDVARRSGDRAVLSYALGVRSGAYMEGPQGERDAEESRRVAEEAGLPAYVALSCIFMGNVLEERGQLEECARVFADGCAVAARQGMPGLIHVLGTAAALHYCELGRLAEARDVLRDVLSTRPKGSYAISSRQVSMLLAVREGRLDEAGRHLRRLKELAPTFERNVGYHSPSALAELLLHTGRYAEALTTLTETMAAHGRPEPKYGDRLLLLGTTVAAEWIVQARDRRDPEAEDEARQALDRLVTARKALGTPIFAGGDADPVQSAAEHLYEAERARIAAEPDTEDRWRRAVEATMTAGMRYHRAGALLRLAEAAYSRTGGQPAARETILEAHHLAVEMGAAPLRSAIESFAVSARISLEPPASAEAHPNGGPLSGLTTREREVLSHLVVGRSYGQIARALFISEKTVSTHVSNLLRKTGTTSRVEAAAFARRNGMGA